MVAPLHQLQLLNAAPGTPPGLLKRTGIFLAPDRSRVLIRPFQPPSEQRITHILARGLALSEAEVDAVYERVRLEFDQRHLKTKEIFLQRFEQVRPHLMTDLELSEGRKLLIGSYFAHEYSLESAALFNPSIMPHPDQSGLADGAVRFILSLRATGEGHISSITFRSGEIGPDHRITVNQPTRYVTEPREVAPARLEKGRFTQQLDDLGFSGEFTRHTLAELGDSFSLEDLRRATAASRRQLDALDSGQADHSARSILDLALSHYQVRFPAEQRLSERVIFPHSRSQSHGIEDARFVHFREDDGSDRYFATYTAYDGRTTRPQLLQSPDFLEFGFIPLRGQAVANKGMALFPRRINGHYAMLSRQDNENIYLMYSEDLHFWRGASPILKPTFDWEFVQLGNCGSPIETDRGWLVLSHGVGPMRKYSIGAFLLDRDDPSRVIGRLAQPLITPTEDEREGYVPNVANSCGAMLHQRTLIIPYAVADYGVCFATVSLDALQAAMRP